MRSLLLLGTDTGVGKTTVARGLLQLAHQRGLRLVPFKPAETGCAPEAADARDLLAAATFCGCPPTRAGLHSDPAPLRRLVIAEVCPYQFHDPIAPSAAARAAGTAISPEVIRSAAAHLARSGEVLLVEGAGGVLTPYGLELTGASLAALLDLDVLLISANRLGTINHTALSVAEIRRRALNLRGIVLVDTTSAGGPDRSDNAREIAALTGVRPLGILRHTPQPTPALLAAHVAADLDLGPLFEGRLGLA